MVKVYFKHDGTGKKFEVIRMSADKKTITLKGEAAEFTEPYDKERFKKMGYTLCKEDDDAE